jgi:hypothetical protein
MTLWRRAPRSVYQVYGEDQYLAGDGEPVREDRDEAEVQSHGSRSGRLLAFGLLAGVMASALGLVALDVLRHSPPAHSTAVAHSGPVQQSYPAEPAPTPPAPERLVRKSTAHSWRATVPTRSDARPLKRSTGQPEAVVQDAVPYAIQPQGAAPTTTNTESQADGEFGFER